MNTYPEGYFGVLGEQTSEKDFQLAAGIVDLPRPRHTYWDLQHQYDQTEVSFVCCTTTANQGAVTDLTGNIFSLDQRRAIWDEAIRLGANPSVGWWINKATNLVREFSSANFDKEKLVTFRVTLAGDEFNDCLEKGYSMVVGYSGNANFSFDKNDGVLNLVKLDSTSTFAHCLRMVKHEDGSKVRMIVDNYPSFGHNTYDIPMENLPILLANNVFFKESYVFAYKADVMHPPSLVSAFAVSSVEKAKKHGILDWSNPQQPVDSVLLEDVLKKLGLLTVDTDKGCSKERLMVALDRANLLN